MSTTLLERLFPASEHSSLRVTLRTAESFERDFASPHKRRRLDSDEASYIPKRRAISSAEADVGRPPVSPAISGARNGTTPLHTRSWSVSASLQRRYSGHDAFLQNGTRPHILQTQFSKIGLSRGIDSFARQGNSHRSRPASLDSTGIFDPKPRATHTMANEPADYHLGLAAISDQVLNGVRLTTHERDWLEDLIPTSSLVIPEVEEPKQFPDFWMSDLDTDSTEAFLPGFVIMADTSDEEDDSASDFSNFFDLDEASEERSPPVSKEDEEP